MYSHALSTRWVKKSWLLSKLKCLCVGFIAEHKYQVNLSIYVTIQKWLGSKGLSLTLFASLAMVAEAFSMRLQSSASADGGPKVGEVVDHLEDTVLFLTTSRIQSYSWCRVRCWHPGPFCLSFSGWQWAQCLCMLKQRGLCVSEGPHSDQITKLFISMT